MKNLTINQGDSLYITVILYDEDNNKIDFEETDVVRLSAKKKIKQTKFDIVSEPAELVEGEMIIYLPPKKTNIPLGNYYYDIEYMDSNEDVYTLVKGILTIDWEVSENGK